MVHADQANRCQNIALICRLRQHSRWLSPRRPREQRPEQRPQLSTTSTQWLVAPTPTERTEARAAPSDVVPSYKVAGCAHADQANRGQSRVLTFCVLNHSGWLYPPRPVDRGQSSALTCRASHHISCLSVAYQANRGQISPLTCHLRHTSGWLSLRRPREQRPEQRPQLSCPLPQWLAQHTPTKRIELSSALNSRARHLCRWLSPRRRSQCSAINCCVRQRSGCLRLRRPIEQRSGHRPHLWCPPPLWLYQPTPTERTETRAVASPDVPANKEAGCAHAGRWNRGQTSALTCRARHQNGWLSPSRWMEQRPV
jgi:hypothetical protein